MREQQYTVHTVRRGAVALTALLLVFAFLLTRLFLIQFFDFERYQQKVMDQLTTSSPVRAARGEILDAAGRVLATTRTVYRISVFPALIAKAPGDKAQAIIEGLAATAGVSPDAVREHLSHTRELSRTVVRETDSTVAAAVLAMISERGLSDLVAVEAVPDRYYPNGGLAAQVLGFTGSDGQGLYGLELQYNSVLSGVQGAYITARDSTGNRLPNRYEALVPATDGSTLKTTLDAFVQAVLEEQLEATMIESGAANRACGIVMDVQTGAVLAMATVPTFDLNAPFLLNEYAARELAALGVEGDSDLYKETKNALLLESWSNKAATEIYMPGSTFKAITCSAVIEEEAVRSLEERFFCSGALAVADRLIHCHKVGGHGSLTFAEGLQNSCNPVMMTIAARLGTDCFYSYVSGFGMLEKTGIDLPGEGGSIFHAKSSFTDLDLATASFGQNFKVSVLQMITAISAVANGGKLVQPYLVQSITNAAGETVYSHETVVKRQVISEQTAKTVSRILADGVAGNGGAKNAYVAGYRVAAKTGTSEKIGDDRNARIGSCVGFAPADDPKIAVIVVVDEPTDGIKYGSVVAAPYVANVFEAVLPYLGVEAVYTDEELENLTVKVPNLVGLSVAEATAVLEKIGVGVTYSGEGEIVSAQSPASGTAVLRRGAKAVLTLTNDAPAAEQAVPNVVGLTAAAANRLLQDSGFNITVCGAKDYYKVNKSVCGQSPAAGTLLPSGASVSIYFSYDAIKE
ncbi:MAG: PASTA domain-containing protein [Ruminococcaceae bacterium]|nr:PASTA domain-containing protein [Oscillospiraceae bacterium]